MTEPDEGLKILASAASAQRISRRAFMGGSAVAAFSGGFLLSACSKQQRVERGVDERRRIDRERVARTRGPAELLPLGRSTTIRSSSSSSRKSSDRRLQIDTYASNEEAIAKLAAAAGSSGYDIVVPTGPYIPQMVANDLLEELDLSKIPNFKNLDTRYTNQPWDPGNKHSVCKDWGTTGWIVDKSQISRPINTWSDFIDVAMNEASGNMSLLDAQNEVYGRVLLGERDRLDDHGSRRTSTRTRRATLDSWRHTSKAFESYPGYQFSEWELRVVARVERRCHGRGSTRSRTRAGTPGAWARPPPSCGWTTGRS